MTDFSKLSDTTAGDAVNACKAETDRLRSELEAVKRKLSSIRDMIPMNYLMRHDVYGATGPTERLDLVAAVRDYSDARWRIIDRLKRAEAGLEAVKREAVEVLKPFAEAAFVLDEDVASNLRAEDSGILEDCLWPSQQPNVGHLRAARAFVEKHGRDGNG
jgi:hypothetical protein